MAQLIEPAMESPTHRPLEITAISGSANSHAPAAGRIDTLPSAPPLTPEPTEAPDTTQPGKVSRRPLKILDEHFGPLRFGNSNVTRVELKALGAMVYGHAISEANANINAPDQLFIDGLSFDPAKVQARVRSAKTPDTGTVATLFYEIAISRSVGAPSLFVTSEPLKPGSPMDRLDKLGKSAQKLDIHAIEPLTGWGKTKNHAKHAATPLGVGMQAYGIYSGLMGAMEAMRVGDTGEAAFNGAAIATEFGSLIIERGLTKGGIAMIESGSVVLRRFSATSVGVVFSRGGGLFASAITVPFDIVSAVKEFNAAAASKGKVAQDHYVNGGINVASAGISLVLGAAALAGYGSVAGPVGLAAAVILIVGAKIYQAARIVDDIDDYIELDGGERLVAGWLAFWGREQAQDVMDRYKIAKSISDHKIQLEQSAKFLLEEAHKEELEYIVNGSFDVTLRTIKIWYYQWDENNGEQPYKLDNEPVIVGTDDVIDARDGVPPNLRGMVKGTPGENKGIFWRLGDGNDQVFGVRDKSNLFSYREGTKTLSGGDKDDVFYFETTESELNRPLQPARISDLDGGEGSDTLAFTGSRTETETRHVGYDVNLQTGKVALRHQDPRKDDIPVMQVNSIEKISTLRRGSNRVTGSDQADQISANGHDRIDAGPGDDTIAIRGAYSRVNGGPGADTYYIADTSANVTIIEDGEQPSLIRFDWPMERVQRLQVVGTSLVINSLQGQDGELPDHELTIEQVYEYVDGQRQLKNNQLRFIFQDSFEMLPLLTFHLPDSNPCDIEYRVTGGQDAPTPYIINSATVVLAERMPMHHFISRVGRRVDVIAYAGTPKTSAVFYMDYTSEEIVDVRISYEVEKKIGVSDYTYLTYSNFNLWIELTSKIVNFTGIIREQPHKVKHAAYTSGSIWKAGEHSAHDIVLIMRDGKSYRLTRPNISYLDDAAAPGRKMLIAPECLKLRHGHYRFVSPARVKPVLLATTPQQVNFPAPPHAGIYVLHGQASKYDVYPVSDTMLSLSTPGAAAQTSNASTWTLFSTKLTETVTRNGIRLRSDNLQVGSAVIQLPSLDHPGPVESISVVTTSGNIYSVELLFEVLQLYVINAQGYASIDALLTDIRAHQERSELAVSVVVKNIGFSSRTDGTVYYNSMNDYWGIDTDSEYRINPEHLIIERAKDA
ncbi:Ca2+-binding RTX toxin-like protein [Pseudomonas lini]|uniref:calcium-binding protein n=1 Tax=Pseudomonas lini TaxID=163011 RepID=UPI00278499D4|nr:calcium-binding protein [Pseudomonas lini]MDQ0126215.1 Ca2+-binding RTX toxin-like protein [Pseudomonas lini]